MNDLDRSILNVDTYIGQIDTGVHEIEIGVERIQTIKGELKGVAYRLREEKEEREKKMDVRKNSLFTDCGYGEKCFELLGTGYEKVPAIQKNLLLSIAQSWVHHPLNDSKTPFADAEDLRNQLPRFDPFSPVQIATVLDALIAKMSAKGDQPAAF